MRQRRRPKFRRLPAFLLAVILCLTLASPALAADDAAASSIQLAKTEGTVSATNSAGRNISLVKNLRLFSGYHVLTEASSYAWLNLDSSKLLKEDASSNVEVRKSGKKLEVLLRSGNLFFNVTEPLDDDETLNIRTSTTLTGVRGTCGWVEVIDRWNTDVYILEGKVECVVTDPVSGENELATISAGETATFTVSPGSSSAPNEVKVTRTSCDVEDIPGYVLVDLAEDEALCGDILDASGLDILGELSRNGDAAAEAQRRLEEEEAAAARRLASIAAREQAQASKVESAPNSSGTPSTPVTPVTPVTPDPDIPSDLTMAGSWGWKYDEGTKTLYIGGSGAMNDYQNPDRPPWFERRKEIESVVIGVGITHIGQNTFIGCEKMSSVTIPNGVTSIGINAFSNCDGLTSVTLPSTMTNIGNNAFFHCSNLSSVTIPNSVTRIGTSAFANCALTSVTIPDSVTVIENSAFRSCHSLASVTIPDSVTSIEAAAFSDGYALTNVTIPDSVTSLGVNVFGGCRTLTSVTIPVSVTSIGDNAFQKCPRLTDVYYGGSEAQWNAIDIGSTNNAPLTGANIHYNSR